MADMIFNMRKTHRNPPKPRSEVLALTHQFAKDDCALAKAAGTNLDLILGGQGKWGFGRLGAMLHYPCASCASCACACVFFLFVKKWNSWFAQNVIFWLKFELWTRDHPFANQRAFTFSRSGCHVKHTFAAIAKACVQPTQSSGERKASEDSVLSAAAFWSQQPPCRHAQGVHLSQGEIWWGVCTPFCFQHADGHGDAPCLEYDTLDIQDSQKMFRDGWAHNDMGTWCYQVEVLHGRWWFWTSAQGALWLRLWIPRHVHENCLRIV